MVGLCDRRGARTGALVCFQVGARTGAGPSRYSIGDFQIVLCATGWNWSNTS